MKKFTTLTFSLTALLAHQAFCADAAALETAAQGRIVYGVKNSKLLTRAEVAEHHALAGPLRRKDDRKRKDEAVEYRSPLEQHQAPSTTADFHGALPDAVDEDDEALGSRSPLEQHHQAPLITTDFRGLLQDTMDTVVSAHKIENPKRAEKQKALVGSLFGREVTWDHLNQRLSLPNGTTLFRISFVCTAGTHRRKHIGTGLVKALVAKKGHLPLFACVKACNEGGLAFWEKQESFTRITDEEHPHGQGAEKAWYLFTLGSGADPHYAPQDIVVFWRDAQHP